jgi:hypothetical protein
MAHSLISFTLFAASVTAILFTVGTYRRRGECPRCHAKLALVRWPRSFRQAMWGGSTCEKCNLEFDRHGGAWIE